MSNDNLIKKYRELTLESEDHWDYRGKDKSEKDYVHGVCTYPAMMVPKMQREMLDVYLSENKGKKIRILDPFAGAGTILVEGMLRGLDIVGIDINPLAILLCKVKTTIILPDMLLAHSKQLIENIDSSEKIVSYDFEGIKKWFTNKAIMDLSIIRNAICQEEKVELRRFYWAAFCEVVRIVSNSRDCTYKLHIKTQKDIDAYDKEAKKLFKNILEENVQQYIVFYNTLKDKWLLNKNGSSYKYKIKIILGDCVEYLKRSRSKYDLVFTSPPYGDNHTTVSYGQYSILPLRWIDTQDIDDNLNIKLLQTQCEIDNVSLGGRRVFDKKKQEWIENKSETLKQQIFEIQEKAPRQTNKIVSFYYDFDLFLAALVKRLKPNAISVWTVGNRKVAKQEIYMDKILVELGEKYNMSLLTSFSRKIPKKRMPDMGAYNGEDKGAQETMTREHILIFARGDWDDRKAIDSV